MSEWDSESIVGPGEQMPSPGAVTSSGLSVSPSLPASFICSFSKYILSACCVPDALLVAGTPAGVGGGRETHIGATLRRPKFLQGAG